MNPRQPKFVVGDRVKVSREERFGKDQRRGVVTHTYFDGGSRAYWHRVEFDDAPPHVIIERWLEAESPLEQLIRAGVS